MNEIEEIKFAERLRKYSYAFDGMEEFCDIAIHALRLMCPPIAHMHDPCDINPAPMWLVVSGKFTKEEIEAWLRMIMENNVGSETENVCAALIKALDNFDAFIARRRSGEYMDGGWWRRTKAYKDGDTE